MSQEKVDRYKKEKSNRKKTLAINKIKRRVGIVCCWVVLVAIVGLIGYKGYVYWDSQQPTKTIYCETTEIDNYLQDLSE